MLGTCAVLNYLADGITLPDDADVAVSGRVTDELMAAFWPTPAGEQSGPGIAEAMNTSRKIVISRTLAQATWPGTQIISG